MGLRDLLFIGVVLSGAAAVSASLFRPGTASPPRRGDQPGTGASAAAPGVPADLRADLRPALLRFDAAMRRSWEERHVLPAPPAPELELMRRLSLSLTGTVPSLEEIRRFETRPEGTRVEAWLDELLHDRRSADYLAERFARAYVGTEDGPFLLFRRRRFTTWLSDAILENRPYDTVVRALITEQGLWTDHPATNFITVTYDPDGGRPDPERLAARVARAFLGVRLDCAQCHDHPFQPWKQADFRGLAAFFGSVHSNLRGIYEGEPYYKPTDRKTKEVVKVEPRVPFRAELRPAWGSEREQLAAWVVDRRNPNLANAMVNRVWALMFGRPLVEPIDDMPASGEVPATLALLADDFSAHDFNLRRLIRLIAASEAFRLDSASGDPEASPSEEQEQAWAAFPITRLRPEQVAGGLFQAASLTTLDGQSPWIVRLLMFNGRNEFVRRFGDSGEDEFESRGGTIPQRLLLMNGDLVRDKTKGELINAAARIAMLAPDDRRAVETAYLAVLTRRPDGDELDHFLGALKGTTGNTRKERLTDLYWTLLNATEFSWNH